MPPTPIDPNSIYSAELDEAIWQDTGLEDEETGEAPAWLVDKSVREGIRWMLEVDRCEEERVRLMDERCALQEWFEEEWKCAVAAKKTAGTS